MSVNGPDFDKYLKEARSWETDRVQAERRSRRVAWAVAGGFGVLAAMGVGGTVLMATRPPAPPSVIRMNDTTGIVDILSTITDAKATYAETVDKYFLGLYIRYREGYTRELAEEYYYNVGLMSCAFEQQKYYKDFEPRNAKSPIRVYGDSGKIRTQIKSTSFIQPGYALVRYVKEITRGNDEPTVTHWAATVRYAYAGAASMSERDRGINPLGFQVCEYRNDADSLVVERRDLPASAATQGRPVGPAVFPRIEIQGSPASPAGAPNETRGRGEP
jgi:type IV secretion system protein VirB8